MSEKKKKVWSGFDVGKASFFAAVDQEVESGRAKITTFACLEFKRNPEGITQFFQWVEEFVRRLRIAHRDGDNRLLFSAFDRLDQPVSVRCIRND